MIPSNFPIPGHDHRHCVGAALDAAEAHCLARGQRLTPLRRRVLELVWAGHGPVGAYALLDALRAEGQAAAPPTVYRTLDFLVAQGLVHRIERLNAFVGCAAPGRPHVGQFLICAACKSVAELDDRAVIAAVIDAAARLGFSVDRQTVEIEGLCPACRAAADG
ncbi:MAG: transcriptional repressor [Alphaproteobacteria bacterium]|nr:transcriptional repressor [Alphaproteobacteria bacterium]